MLKTPLTGVDSNTSITLNFSPSSSSSSSSFYAQAILTSSINAPPPSPGVTIRFSSGAILSVFPPIYSPRAFEIVHADGKKDRKEVSYEGSGWHFQADEVARSVRIGKLETDLWGWEKSLLQMDIFDEVCCNSPEVTSDSHPFFPR